ncbi:MAG: YjbQ family protein, partial [Euryarchaeota archaeon]
MWELTVYRTELTVRTERRVQLVDITGDVREAVSESGVKEGIVHVFSRHTTAAVIVNEPESG